LAGLFVGTSGIETQSTSAGITTPRGSTREASLVSVRISEI
jgi:hypothetical protein